MDSDVFKLGKPTPAEEVGYARVSDADDQDPDFQIALLKDRGIPDDNIFVDKASGRSMSRPRLKKALMLMEGRPGWTLVVYKLDRLGRNLKGLIELAEWFDEHKLNLVSLTEQIDTRTPIGRCFFAIMAAIGQLESDLIAERTRAGMARAKQRGAPIGRQPKFTMATMKQIQETLEREPWRTLVDIGEQYDCSPEFLRKHWPAWRRKSPDERREYRRTNPLVGRKE